MVIDAKKAYAVYIKGSEVELISEHSDMKRAEKLWNNPKYRMHKDFATLTGVGLLKLLEVKKLVEKLSE